VKTETAKPSVAALEPAEDQLDAAIIAIHRELEDLLEQLPRLRRAAALAFIFGSSPDARLEDARRRIAYLEDDILPALEPLKALAADRRLAGEIEDLVAPLPELEAQEAQLTKAAAAINPRSSILTAQAFESALHARDGARTRLHWAMMRLKDCQATRSNLRAEHRKLFESERDEREAREAR
jgi:hypothetical protein